LSFDLQECGEPRYLVMSYWKAQEDGEVEMSAPVLVRTSDYLYFDLIFEARRISPLGYEVLRTDPMRTPIYRVLNDFRLDYRPD
jgi:hypothetical protein